MDNKLCDKCQSPAIWYYMPSSDIQYCDECVPRGCSCNIFDNESDEEYVDDFGRKYPCVEYMECKDSDVI